jgi:hypothetical protein
MEASTESRLLRKGRRGDVLLRDGSLYGNGHKVALAASRRAKCRRGHRFDCYTPEVSNGRSTRIDAIPRSGQKVSSYPGRRICGEAACLTVLSRYNGAIYCWVHESPTYHPGSALRR